MVQVYTRWQDDAPRRADRGRRAGAYPTERHNASDPYFNLPLAAVSAINAAGTPIGIARGAMDVFLARLPGRGITCTIWEDQSGPTHVEMWGRTLCGLPPQSLLA